MSRRKARGSGDPGKRAKILRGDDPRELSRPDRVAGPGGPFDRHEVVLDTTAAILADHSTGVLAHPDDGRDVLALVVDGRVNGSSDRVSVMPLLDADGAGSLASEILSISKRHALVTGSAALDDQVAAAFRRHYALATAVPGAGS